MNLNIKKLNENAIIPTYAHETDAGFDLYAAEEVIIKPEKTRIIKTGLAIDVPKGYELQIRPRSGITTKTNLRVQLGTIDSGYKGEIGVIVDNISTYGEVMNEHHVKLSDSYFKNHSSPVYYIFKGDKIAQAVLSPVIQASFNVVDDLGESERGVNGYGSTGVSND
ncbi:dUTP diphosphatase [Virgibacillus salexigens]|uniref:dUTP diphosphatase n=1 Tax=Virgibacillus salexigens TaxID=61016 RepID=UPI0019091266|nr:deoxyuridine 5'-triphosphate nucleotidohydrolase [Virgibacillus salexigens]